MSNQLKLQYTDDATSNYTYFENVSFERTSYLKFKVVAIQVGGSAGTVGDTHVWDGEFVSVSDGSTDSILGTPTVNSVENNAGASAWTVECIAPEQIKVTGEVNKEIKWAIEADTTVANTQVV